MKQLGVSCHMRMKKYRSYKGKLEVVTDVTELVYLDKSYSVEII